MSDQPTDRAPENRWFFVLMALAGVALGVAVGASSRVGGAEAKLSEIEGRLVALESKP